MPQIFINNARGVLAASVPSGETSLSLKNGTHLPASLAVGDWFLMTLFNDASRYGSNVEVVKVTAISDDGGGNYTLTVERGYEGDNIVHAGGEKVEARVTAQTLRNLLDDAKAYTDAELSTLLDSAPEALDTLNELAEALNNDPDFATTVTNSIAQKLSASSYTAADVLAKLLTVDGEGSALDADTLDGKHLADIRADHEAEADPHTQYYNQSRLAIWSRDKERQALEAATGGLCTIERTASGQACHMYVLPRMTWNDLIPGGELGSGTHEAFLENGVEKSELLAGMYMAAEINGEMVSQPRTVGRRSITWDQSVSAAQASGFQLFGNWEWSAIALWCMANGFQPRGNTDYGQSHSHPHERGAYDGDGSGEEYTLLGSGPNTWSHNNAANGIADLVGNRWEWVRGFKMMDGRILLAPDNDPTLAESAWVDTGWDMPSNGTWASQNATGAPESIKRALIMPNGVADPEGYLYTSLSGERFPFRGGNRNNAGNAGLAALHLNNARSFSNTFIGLRLSRLV